MRDAIPRDSGTTESDRPILAAEAISKSFGGVAALKDVRFELRAGEIHALMGENGAGKSTLMKVLSGVYTDYEGAIRVDGETVRFSNVRDAEAAGIAIIHQELNLVPELGVADNIFLGRERVIAGLFVDRKASLEAARGLLNRLGIELDPEARVGQLRVGEQQLVEIAKALSVEARILIMDEPTSALSPGECRRLFKIMRQLAADGVGIIYISHRIDEVMQLSDRVTVFRDGRHVWARPMAGLDENTIIAAMVGRNLLDAHRRDRGKGGGEPVLSVRDLSLAVSGRHGWRDVLKGVSFDVRAGEILGIGGLLGAGRTEILETIFASNEGLRGGEIRLDGIAVNIRSPRDARRLGFALVTEDRKAKGLHLHESIRDNVALPLVGRLARFGLRSFEGERALAKGAVDALGVRCAGTGQAAGTLSGGNQQKVVIGKWLATGPRVLLLDEPTRGIDVGAKREIYDLIFKLAGDGLAIVVVSSELPELLLLADRILVMAEGRQTGLISREEASEERIMQLAAPRSARGRAVA
ncbi:sugar ABC transporter ATP-binding protein [Sinorhizobium meliloti]|uniref:sugar ABC transporter ATP-binding protein n=1 Tax=Rhizobium meliloti TaxID=382 RepID=UPI000B4994B7|nr:sugar ABC transporter ATP-binding protein [Sinorhizobium meliloti]TWB00819.1 monosaccharide ABC transporter ATP-binding protein (CUT2 family) [Ensifer sp. SEMIA 134]TWB37442.1 monosaccharide ABC transporter ATP-binding protein (CUT2 family) [Ensifer sp. SEMIA 135]ASQ00430.1 sugar ABC transporter ATP-binding protein [Sinorhizobium meliloti]MDW9578093.1 ATP-binding cassette domain-containing protein [Sinorhizobium meliloti]MDW9612001.1 ATP-binding cassette domain-containing protein [Sinorhizo